MRALRIALLTASLIALPGQASAATINGGATITVTSGAEAEDFYVADAGDILIFSRNDATAAALTAGANCTQTTFSDEVTCPRANVVANLGDGDDKASFDIGVNTVEAHGGGGHDELVGGPSADRLFGDAGTDYIDGRGGGDDLNGGVGNDTFEKLTAGDSVTGGEGVDDIQFYGAPEGVFISLDDVDNDGIASARTANVRADVEDVHGSPFDDVLIGNAAANELNGSAGNDQVKGGAGVDTLRGDVGNDSLDAVDDVKDNLGCGDGTDTIIMDALDAVDDCETVQVSGPDNDGDGVKAPADCNDSNAAVRPGAADVPGNGVDEDCSGADAPLLDRDLDGSTANVDCNDTNASIRPGAPDKPGDEIDQDCDGTDDPFTLVAGTITLTVKRSKVTVLKVSGVQPGASATVRCKGRGCPFKTRTLKLVGGAANGKKPFGNRRLRSGTVIEVQLSAPDMITRIRRVSIRNGKAKVQSLCLTPGAPAPVTC